MGKNIQKVQDMVDGNYKSKIQIGTHIEKDVHANRKVGDIWTDSDGDQWEQKEGYRSKVSTLAAKGLGDNCPDCKKLIVKGWDKDSYKWNKRCYYCQIDHEAESPRNIQGVDHINKEMDKHTKNIIERGDNYIKGWLKEKEIYEKEAKEEKVFDKAVANALANENVEMTINKNKTMTK